MSTMDVKHGGLIGAEPGDQYQHAHHFRTQAEEFDAVKLGFWLFLTTEILLFGGIFCAYLIFRAWYPAAWAEGSGNLDWRWGGANTVLLLVSSYTMAAGIYACQTGQYRRMRLNLLFTIIAGLLFVAIKFVFEYTPKWSGYFFFLDPSLHHYEAILTGNKALGGLFVEVAGYGGKRPGMLFSHPFASDPHVPMWWSVYYSGTALHALHVLVGVALIARVYIKSLSGTYGPKYYTGVEIAGLYWHLVDLIWIFLFPLLYLIH
jgi:cytochrome c oxidase subunit 3